MLIKFYITTDDGSVGFKGFTIQLMPEILKENNIDTILYLWSKYHDGRRGKTRL